MASFPSGLREPAECACVHARERHTKVLLCNSAASDFLSSCISFLCYGCGYCVQHLHIMANSATASPLACTGCQPLFCSKVGTECACWNPASSSGNGMLLTTCQLQEALGGTAEPRLGAAVRNCFWICTAPASAFDQQPALCQIKYAPVSANSSGKSIFSPF